MKVTGQEVADALTARGNCRIPCHNCSICNYPCGYLYQDGLLWYDHGCDCTRNGYTRSQSFVEDLADWVNMQSNPKAAERIWLSITGKEAA